MISLIKRLFIKDSDNTSNAKVRAGYGFVAGIVGIICNILLFVIKILIGLLVGSISIIADAINNLSDMGSSLITMVAFKMSVKPADDEHPYGHGRIEYISGLIISVTIIFLGLEMLRSSVEKILFPTDMQIGNITIAVLIISIFIKLWLCLFNRSFGKSINSQSLKATAIDSLNDAVATFAILLSILTIKLWGVNIDGYVGVAVSLYILVCGVKSLKETVGPLLGEKTDAKTVMDILKIANSYDDILGVHDLVVHDYGPGRKFATLHAEVSPHQDILTIHKVVDRCEREILEKLAISISIHIDPIETDNKQVMELKKEVEGIISQIDARLSIHDFRVAFEETHTNLIFDMVLPYDLSDQSERIFKTVRQRILENHLNHYCIIQTDHLYS